MDRFEVLMIIYSLRATDCVKSAQCWLLILILQNEKGTLFTYHLLLFSFLFFFRRMRFVGVGSKSSAKNSMDNLDRHTDKHTVKKTGYKNGHKTEDSNMKVTCLSVLGWTGWSWRNEDSETETKEITGKPSWSFVPVKQLSSQSFFTAFTVTWI